MDRQVRNKTIWWHGLGGDLAELTERLLIGWERHDKAQLLWEAMPKIVA